MYMNLELKICLFLYCTLKSKVQTKRKNKIDFKFQKLTHNSLLLKGLHSNYKQASLKLKVYYTSQQS